MSKMYESNIYSGGQNYGDLTLDEFKDSVWVRSATKTLRRKREFAGFVTAPSQWFSQC